jgi:hypothetical protein
LANGAPLLPPPLLLLLLLLLDAVAALFLTEIIALCRSARRR